MQADTPISPPPGAGKKGLLEALGLHRKELRSWAMYDWACSAFTTTIVAAVLPIYYADVAAKNLEQHERTAYWGYTAGIALLVVAFLAPVLGAISDCLGTKKKFLGTLLAMGCIATALLVLVGEGDWVLASTLFIIGNICYASANVFNDAMLPHVARPEEMDRVSTAAYALGYVGGGLLLAINLAWIMVPDVFGFESSGQAVRFSFFSVAIWWALFSIPILRHVPEPHYFRGTDEIGHIVGVGFKRLIKTFRQIRQYKQLVIFLISFWFYTDGIGTIIKMATIYGREIGIGPNHLIGALLLVQFLGIPTTFAFGTLASRIGAKAGIMIALVVYTGICVLGFFMSAAWHFWALACLVAMVQGGCQALSRSLYATMIPMSKSSEFFSFMSVSNKFAGVFGPLLFGILGQWLGGSRFSILFLITFFVVGMALLALVDVEKGKRAALEAEANLRAHSTT